MPRYLLSPQVEPMPEDLALSASYGSYVDATVINSVLAGVIILLGAIWSLYAFNRLWQGSLLEEAAGGIEAARALGLQLKEPGYRSRLVAVGQIDGIPARIEWKGGVTGARSRVRLGRKRTRVPLIIDEASLAAALAQLRAEVES